MGSVDGTELKWGFTADMAVCSFREAGGRRKVPESAAEPSDTWH